MFHCLKPIKEHIRICIPIKLWYVNFDSQVSEWVCFPLSLFEKVPTLCEWIVCIIPIIADARISVRSLL